MEYTKAKTIGDEVIKKLLPYIDIGQIAGSIRREKPQVHDIDLVIVPKREFMVIENIKSILKSYGKIVMDGEKIIRVVSTEELEIDCYIATLKNYEILLLIRTGSKEHNQKLCQTALRQGKQLKFNEGLLDAKTGKILANNEKDIFANLNMPYLEPKDRD